MARRRCRRRLHGTPRRRLQRVRAGRRPGVRAGGRRSAVRAGGRRSGVRAGGRRPGVRGIRRQPDSVSDAVARRRHGAGGGVQVRRVWLSGRAPVDRLVVVERDAWRGGSRR